MVSVCLPSFNTYRLSWVSLTLEVGYLFTPCNYLRKVIAGYLEQEIDGPQAEQFLFCNRNSIKGGRWNSLSPAQIRDERPYIPHPRSYGDLPNYTRAERIFEGQKQNGHHLIVSDVSLPINLFTRIHLLDKRCKQTQGGTWDIPNTDSEPGKSSDWRKENLRKCPMKFKCHEGATQQLPLWAQLCVYPMNYSFFSLLINSSLVSLFFVSVRILFSKAKGSGLCH